MDTQRLRPLGLRGEETGHPFRQSLPIDIVQVAGDGHDSDIMARATEKGLGEDASLFLLSFLAFFTAFYTFII